MLGLLILSVENGHTNKNVLHTYYYIYGVHDLSSEFTLSSQYSVVVVAAGPE